MCKFVLFGSFYSKIGLDTCITAVKETKENIHIHILVRTTLQHPCLPLKVSVQFILSSHTKGIRACGKVYFQILSGSKLGLNYGYIISEHADGTRWTLLCPGNCILTMPSMTFPYNIIIDNNDNNIHHYTSHGITFTVTEYDPIKLIISKYSPPLYITFMMHKCTIKETSLWRDSEPINNVCT